MQESEIRPQKSTLFWSLVAFSLMVVCVFSLYYFNIDKKSPINYISYLPFVVCLALAIKSYKDANQFMSFGTGFKTGFKFASLLSFLMGLFMLIYLKWLNPSVFEQGLVDARLEMVRLGQSPGQINMSMDLAQKWGPYMAAITTTFMYTISGAFLSAIFAAVFKNSPSTYTAPLD
jgi:hypothetical protein